MDRRLFGMRTNALLLTISGLRSLLSLLLGQVWERKREG